MNIGKTNDLWDISDRPHTKTKLDILKKCFGMWLTVWNNQAWAYDEWYIIDLFAGRGTYKDGEQMVNGSPLIYLDTIAKKKDKLRQNLAIKLFFVEDDSANFGYLKDNVDKFKEDNPQLKNIVNTELLNDDCNKVIERIIKKIDNTDKNPLFVFIDPYGIKIQKPTIEQIVKLKNRKDIMFNYILEAVRRTSGIARKKHYGEELTFREIRTLQTLKDFIGDDINLVDENGLKALDLEVLADYVRSLFTPQDLNVVAYDMPYPDRNDILYYLLYASKNQNITNIVKDIYARQKEDNSQPLLFGNYKDNIITVTKKIEEIERRSLLYKTGVEYGSWTINHVAGCKHGCDYPCYAYMLSKRFGRVKDYNDWRTPKIISNTLELLEDEIRKYKDQLDFVHLSFMTDPFMYDADTKDLIPEIKNLTLKIIERLNKANIRVTVLTKGFYPDEILKKLSGQNEEFLMDNEYGISLVSLSDKFKQRFEQFSAPFIKRIDSLKKLNDAGLKTWVSIEPYPTPNLDETSKNIEKLLDSISFVDKIVFGRLNYNIEASKFPDNENFYKRTAETLIKFCQKNDIIYHIKEGTPYSEEKTKKIFK